MDAQDRVRLLAEQAASLVQGHVGPGAALHDPLLVAARERSLVVRCAVTGWDGVDALVFKRNEGDDARGFTDWTSLAFLSTLAEATGLAPRFYAGDVQARLFVMEDLGRSHSLEDVLGGGDTTAVVDVLEALAASMARLAVATRGQEEVFERMRAGLPGAAELGRRREATRWLEALARVVQWAETLGLRLPRGFEGACAHIAGVFADPGAYLAFSHGDPAPSNNHIAPRRVSLIDFEYGGYRHVLYDITAWTILCPLPMGWVRAMERVFRRVLGASPMTRALVEDGQYQEAWAAMCAYRALAMISWFSPDILARDRAWTPGWTRRAALISTTLRLHQASAGIAAFAPLADLGAQMAAALQARWPELGDGALRWPGVAGVPPH